MFCLCFLCLLEVFSIEKFELGKFFLIFSSINNLILAIPSSGIHSNGYSLIRYILNKKKIKFFSYKIRRIIRVRNYFSLKFHQTIFVATHL